jgi:hypothetical protein
MLVRLPKNPDDTVSLKPLYDFRESEIKRLIRAKEQRLRFVNQFIRDYWKRVSP